MDRLTSMAVFARAVELGSFVQTAGAFGISPTMVAKHVKALEHQLGGIILQRSTRRQGLTILGEHYYDRCKRILDEVADAQASAASLQKAPRGGLRIAAPPAYGTHVVTPLLVRFLNRYPEISAEVVLADRKVDLISEGFELGFRIGKIDDDGVIARALPPYELVVAASPDYLARAGHPTHPNELSAHEVIGFRSWGADRIWRLSDGSATVDVEVRPRLIVNNGASARSAALAGFGIVLQSLVTLDDDLRQGRLVRLLPKYAPVAQAMNLIYLPARHRSERLKAFISFFMASLTDPAYEITP